MLTEQLLLNGQPVTIVAIGERGQVLIETADGRTVLVHKRGLQGAQTKPIKMSSLRVDDPRKFAPAR